MGDVKGCSFTAVFSVLFFCSMGCRVSGVVSFFDHEHIKCVTPLIFFYIYKYMYTSFFVGERLRIKIGS